MSQILDDFLCVFCFSSPRLASGIHSKRPKNANYHHILNFISMNGFSRKHAGSVCDAGAYIERVQKAGVKAALLLLEKNKEI